METETDELKKLGSHRTGLLSIKYRSERNYAAADWSSRSSMAFLSLAMAWVARSSSSLLMFRSILVFSWRVITGLFTNRIISSFCGAEAYFTEVETAASPRHSSKPLLALHLRVVPILDLSCELIISVAIPTILSIVIVPLNLLSPKLASRLSPITK